MLKTIIIVFLALATIAIGGAGYYYFGIYQPREYGTKLLLLHQKLESSGLEPDASPLAGVADYENALGVLDGRVKMLELIKKDLAAIKTPKRMENYRKEFEEYIDFLLPRHEHARDLAEFLMSANALHEALEALEKSEEQTSPNQQVGDFQKIFIERFSKIQTAGCDFVGKEIDVETDPSFAELKALWDGASPGFDLVLQKLISLDPKLPISRMNSAFTASEQKQLNSYTPKVEELSKKLDDLVKKYTAYDILAFKHFPDATSIEASERALRFYQIMRGLKGK